MSGTRSLVWKRLLGSIPVLSPLTAQSGSGSLRELLIQVEPVTNDKTLAQLFRFGDDHIEELVAALADPDEKVRLGAQRLIGYLGNPSGMAALRESFRHRDHYAVTGTVPVPLDDWDYKEIEKDILCRECPPRGPMFSTYINALILDGSTRARDVLARFESRNAGSRWMSLIPATDSLRIESAQPERDLLAHSFFLDSEDKLHATGRELAYTNERKKGLFEVYGNHGPLAEKWFHVVLVRHGPGWKFLSVDPVGMS